MMRVLEIRQLLVASALAMGVTLAGAGVGHASPIIEAGWDLFETVAPAQFDFNTVPNPQIVSFEGLPLGCYDFGAGCEATFSTDTIVQRLSPAQLIFPDNDTIDIEIVALSLISTGPVDLGFGAGFEDLFVTLNTSSPSQQSQMTIFDTGEGSPHGTFDSLLNFSFDVTGGVGGFYGTVEQIFNSAGTSWSHDHAGDALQIDGVNHNLDGGGGHSHSEDFHVVGVLHTGPHPVSSAVPEPSTALLLCAGLVVALRRGRSQA